MLPVCGILFGKGAEGLGSRNDVSLSVSDRTLASLHDHGDDRVLVAGDKVSGVLTLAAVHDSGAEDSLEMFVAGSPTALDVAVDVDVARLEGKVTLTLLDSKGNKTAYYEDVDGDNPDYRILVPAKVEYFNYKKFEDGKTTATFNLEAEEEGSYAIRVVTDLGLSKSFDVDFVTEVERPGKPRYGAARVNMEIGSPRHYADNGRFEMDVAPFIEDNRTFVPVRFLANALGVEDEGISWSPATGRVERVTLAREDVTVEIAIGQQSLTVTDNETGEAETIEMDVAALIRNDRTFLPFRFIAEAFGAEVDWGPKDAPTEWVTFTQE